MSSAANKDVTKALAPFADCLFARTSFFDATGTLLCGVERRETMAESERFLLAGVMGWPVMHSRSPLLHGYWMKQLGLAGAYVPLAIEPAGLAAALRALRPLQFAGCNLTIPHKQAAMAFVDEVDPVGRTIGAISCVVVRPDGSLFGSNNDWYGFVENLKASVPNWRATRDRQLCWARAAARARCATAFCSRARGRSACSTARMRVRRRWLPISTRESKRCLGRSATTP